MRDGPERAVRDDPLLRPPVRSDVVVMEAAIVAAVEAAIAPLVARIEALERRSGIEPDEAVVRLLRLIREFAADRLFNAAELVRHSAIPENAALRAAIVDAVGLERQARRLGKLFARLQGRTIGGVQVVRHGRDRDGSIWRVTVASHCNVACSAPAAGAKQ